MRFGLLVTNDVTTIIFLASIVINLNYLRNLPMVLKKQSNPSARWDFKANSWWVGESVEYQWVNEKSKEYSPWMNLDNALIWIKEHDEDKNHTNLS